MLKKIPLSSLKSPDFKIEKDSMYQISLQVAAARGAVDREFDYIENLKLAVLPPPSAQRKS